MKNEETKKRVLEIYEESKNLQEELSNLRKKCSHDSYRIGYYSWRIGAMDTVKLCNHCDENIGQPSIEEVEKFNSEIGQSGQSGQFTIKTDK
ncbi:MAG: hypothetical protein AABY15_04155 [Nanoarchaeota archaeon]